MFTKQQSVEKYTHSACEFIIEKWAIKPVAKTV